MVLPELFTSDSGKPEKKNDSVVLMQFCFAVIGLEKLVDQEFSCPCDPAFNVILVSSVFSGPALLALCVMVFIQRPCRRSSTRCVRALLFSLIPPLLWMFLLLLEGEYVACGVSHWKGDFVLDEEVKIKWCKPSRLNEGRVNGTELLERTKKVIFYSRFSALVFITLVAAVLVVVVSCWDCRVRRLEMHGKQNNPGERSTSSVYGSEVELQQSF